MVQEGEKCSWRHFQPIRSQGSGLVDVSAVIGRLKGHRDLKEQRGGKPGARFWRLHSARGRAESGASGRQGSRPINTDYTHYNRHRLHNGPDCECVINGSPHILFPKYKLYNAELKVRQRHHEVKKKIWAWPKKTEKKNQPDWAISFVSGCHSWETFQNNSHLQ